MDARLIRKAENDEQINPAVQPDLFMLCDASGIDEKSCMGSPDLVIEILFPGYLHQDLRVKYEVYEETGIGEYRVVFSSKWVNDFFCLKTESTALRVISLPKDDIPVHSIPGFSVPGIEVFER